MTWTPIGEVAKVCVERAIERLRAMPEHAGRPAWDQIVAEEMTLALKTRSTTLVTAQTLERWAEVLASIMIADEAAIKVIDKLIEDMRAAAYKMEDGA